MAENIWGLNMPVEAKVRIVETKIQRRQPQDPFLQEILNRWFETHGGRSYLVVADGALGYCWWKSLRKHTTSKKVSDILTKLILKLGIPYNVQMDRGPKFWGPFQELDKEFGVPNTPSSPYNPESIGMAKHFVGITKLLLKKTLDAKEDFQKVLSYLNNSARYDEFSPVDLFYKWKPCSFLSNII